MKTSILCDGVVVATGHAEEIRNMGNVNKTSSLENCETSSLGRALANGGYAAKGRRPSREEMQKVSMGSPNTVKTEKPILKEKFPEPVKDAWTIENPKDVQEVVEVEGAPSLIEAINLLTDEMNAKEVPQAPKCQHDFMIHKTGVSSKTGKPYEGYTCSHKNRAEQCPPIWL
jgi:hypothetical protein